MYIDLICFTGDLIQQGDKAIEDENQWELANDIFLKPLVKAQMRFYGIDLRIDKDLMDLITSIHIKLNPSLKSGYRQKSLITKTIKEKLDR